MDRLDVSEEKSPRSMQATLSIGVCDDDDDDDDDVDDGLLLVAVVELVARAVVEVVRVTASKAIPAPVAPPPMTKIS